MRQRESKLFHWVFISGSTLHFWCLQQDISDKSTNFTNTTPDFSLWKKKISTAWHPSSVIYLKRHLGEEHWIVMVLKKDLKILIHFMSENKECIKEISFLRKYSLLRRSKFFIQNLQICGFCSFFILCFLLFYMGKTGNPLLYCTGITR